MPFTSGPRRLIVAAVATVMVLAFNGFANAGATYSEAMAACQKAAANAEDPTDYACDWKAVRGGAPGSALTGKFIYREKGMSGEMTILEPAKGPAIVGILTVTRSKNSPTCSAKFEATRHDDGGLVAKMDDPENCTVRIVRVPGPHTIKVTATDACNTFCGLGAAFAGKWQLKTK